METTTTLTPIAYVTLFGHVIDLPSGSSSTHAARLARDGDGMLHVIPAEGSAWAFGPMQPSHWRGDVGQTLLGCGHMGLKIAAADMAAIERAFPGIFRDERVGSNLSHFERELLKLVRRAAAQ